MNFINNLQKKIGNIVIGMLLLMVVSSIANAKMSIFFEGCEKTHTSYELATVPAAGGGTIDMYFCDAANDFTTGNLGPWAELDMVPIHVIFDNLNEDTNSSFTFGVGGDYIDTSDPTLIGWDYVTELALDVNATLLAGGDPTACSATGALASQNLVIAPDQSTIYRVVSVNFPAHQLCVANVNMRLAIGASRYPGSSIRALLTTIEGSIGDKSLPISGIQTTDLSKTMDATQGGSRTWTVSKSSSPGSIHFSDTCDDSLSLNKDINITVSWTRGPITPAGKVNVRTVIQATNLTSRELNFNVEDTLYNASGFLAGPIICPPVILTPETANQIVCINDYSVDANQSTGLYDEANGTFTDPDFPDAAPYSLTATASATVQGTQEITDENATVVDIEQITGNNLRYSAAAPSSGSFVGYTPGTETNGSITWNSGLLADSGSITFAKTVYTDPATIITGGALSDTATLTTYSGVIPTPATISVDITSSATVALTIYKTMDPSITIPPEGLDFVFTVRNALPSPYDENVTVHVDQTGSGSVTITGLVPTLYEVRELPHFGYEVEGSASRVVNLNLPNCSASETFNNILADRPQVLARKVTDPAGNEAGWDMTLYKWNDTLPTPAWEVNATATTTGTDWVVLLGPDELQAGSYKIEETMKAGWYEVNRSRECTFTYDPAIDGNRSDYECSYYNAEYSQVTIAKVVDGVSVDPFGFTQNIDNTGPFDLFDGDTKSFINLYPGTYAVTEDDPTPAFDLINITCIENRTPYSVIDLNNRKATINLQAGEDVTCTYTNQERGYIQVTKLENGDVPVNLWRFTLRGPDIGVLDRNTSISNVLTFENARLIPGETYTLCEEDILIGWDSNWTLNGSSVIPYSMLEDSHVDRCYDFSVGVGETADFVIDNIPPFPGIDIEKFTNNVDGDTPATGPDIIAGTTVTWTYIVTNFGDVNLSDVNVTDSDLNVTVNCPQTTLGVHESMTCTATGTAIVGQYTNIGTVRALPVADLAAEVNASDSSSYFGEVASMTMEKSTNGQNADTPPGPYIVAGGTVDWTYVVTNTGNVNLINVTVTDDQGVAVTCPQTTLDVNASMTCTATGTAVAGQYTNIGTVTGVADSRTGQQATASDSSNYFGEAGAIDIEKYTNGQDADTATGPHVEINSTIAWTYLVTNTGNVDLTNISVTDSDPSVTVICSGTTLPVGGSMTCTAAGIAIAGQYANIGTVTAITAVTGATVTDSDPSHYIGDPNCPCADVNSDSSPAMNRTAGALMIFMTIILGLFFVRREEQMKQ